LQGNSLPGSVKSIFNPGNCQAKKSIRDNSLEKEFWIFIDQGIFIVIIKIIFF